MDRTVQSLLIYGTLGSGIALSTTGHRHIGFVLCLTSLAIVAMCHPRGTKNAILAIPKAMRQTGKAVGKAAVGTGKVIHHAA